jgi:anthranilate synthase/aminodeoxychorismate synthase-like glutamine amidotransferase
VPRASRPRAPRRAGVVRRPPDAPPPGAVWVVDNYDSFTENLAHLLAQLGADVFVARNDDRPVAAVLAARPAAVVVSPGPCTPAEAGISVPLVAACAAADPPVPVLGVCLGHQAIAVAFGGRGVRAREPVHGRATSVRHDGTGSFEGLPSPLAAARYHSLAVARLPKDLVVTARSARGEPMALRHRRLPIEGFQFHPESYLTPLGPRLLARFLRRAGVAVRRGARVVR